MDDPLEILDRSPSKRPDEFGTVYNEEAKLGIGKVNNVRNAMEDVLSHKQPDAVRKLAAWVLEETKAALVHLEPLPHYKNNRRESEIATLIEQNTALIAEIQRLIVALNGGEDVLDAADRIASRLDD